MTDPSPSALGRYAVDLRRRRRVYFAVLAVLAVLLGVFLAVTWSRGELANTTLRTVTSAPRTLAPAAPSTTQQVAWRTTDRVALGEALWQGTVVVWSKHTVRGIDARTGRQTWSYTRSNRTVCAAAQAGGITFAVYMVNGNCDQITGLDSNLGTRKWTRTLDQDGQPLNGRPAIAVAPDTVMFTTPTVIYAVDPVSSYNRWIYSIPGCTINRAVLGSSGVLISQNCTTPKCASLKFCEKGPQLLLRDRTMGRDDKSTVNPERVMWARNGDTSTPVSADTVMSTLDRATGRLSLRSGSNGSVTDTIQVAAGATASTVLDLASVELVQLSGVVYAVTPGRSAALWSRAATGLPAQVGAGDDGDGTARITVPTTGGVVEVDGTSGAVLRTVSLTSVPSTASVVPLGSGYLAGGASGTVAYR